MRLFITTYLLILIVSACGSTKKMDVDQYLSWYNSSENPLIIQDTVTNDFAVYLKQFTPQFNAANCIKTECLPKDTVKMILKESPSTLDFQVKFILPEKNMFNYNFSGEIHASDRLSYYSFDFKNDIKLITTGLDTIDCSSILYERGLPGSPMGLFEFSFPYVAAKKIKEIKIKNSALSNEATVFKMNNTADLPTLKIK